MKIRLKSPEELQAQYVSYGEEQGITRSHRVFNALAEHGLSGASLVDEENYQEYLEYLRSMDGEKRERVRAWTKMLARYSEFKQPVEKLLGSENKVELGKGTHSTVHLLVQGDKKYAVRTPYVWDHSVENNSLIHRHMAAGVVTEGLRGFEQIIAASYEDCVVISEVVPGKHATQMMPEEAEAIPDVHISALVEARVEASKRGVSIEDTHAQNVLYSPEDGFTDIDYHMAARRRELDTVDAMQTVLDAFSADRNLRVEDETEKQNLSAMQRRIITYILGTLNREEKDRLLKAVRDRQINDMAYTRSLYGPIIF